MSAITTDANPNPDEPLDEPRRLNHLWFGPRQTAQFTLWWFQPMRKQGGTILFGSCLFWLVLGLFYLAAKSVQVALWLVVVACIWACQLIVSPFAIVRAVRGNF